MTIPDDGYADGGEAYTDEEMEIICEEEDDLTYEQCPACEGISGYMGTLGNLAWYRCLHCGMEFSIEL